jgi:hypothetical protein
LQTVKFHLRFAEKHAHIPGGVSELAQIFGRSELRQILAVLMRVELGIVSLVLLACLYLLDVHVFELVRHHRLRVLHLVVRWLVLGGVPQRSLNVGDGSVGAQLCVQTFLTNHCLHLLECFELAILGLALAQASFLLTVELLVFLSALLGDLLVFDRL